MNSILLWYFISKKFRQNGVSTHLVEVLKSMTLYGVAALGMGALVWSIDHWLAESVSVLFRVAIGMGVGVVSYLGLSILLKLEESLDLLRMIKRRLG